MDWGNTDAGRRQQTTRQTHGGWAVRSVATAKTGATNVLQTDSRSRSRHDEAVVRHCCVAFGGIAEVMPALADAQHIHRKLKQVENNKMRQSVGVIRN